MVVVINSQVPNSPRPTVVAIWLTAGVLVYVGHVKVRMSVSARVYARVCVCHCPNLETRKRLSLQFG